MGKMGLLTLALVVTLGMMGVAYAKWSDTVTINGTVNTGTISAVQSPGSCYTDPTGGFINWSTSNEVTITNPDDDYVYYAEFSIYNDSTVPVKVQCITVSSLPPGVSAEVTGVGKGDQIHPTGTEQGKVKITLSTGNYVTFSFTVTVETVAWNQYVP